MRLLPDPAKELAVAEVFKDGKERHMTIEEQQEVVTSKIMHYSISSRLTRRFSETISLASGLRRIGTGGAGVGPCFAPD